VLLLRHQPRRQKGPFDFARFRRQEGAEGVEQLKYGPAGELVCLGSPGIRPLARRATRNTGTRGPEVINRGPPGLVRGTVEQTAGVALSIFSICALADAPVSVNTNQILTWGPGKREPRQRGTRRAQKVRK